MDPLKIILFIAVFAALLLLGRMLSSSSEVHASELPAPRPEDAPGVPAPPVAPEQPRKPAVVGSEIEFPIPIPPVRQLADGTYNRPNIVNYFFTKTDLLLGPEDPDCLFDELRVEAQDPGNKSPLTYGYTVATLAGLRQAMDQEKLDSLYLEGNPLVIVPRWDLRLILQTVMDQIIKGYSGEQLEAREEEAEAEESGQ